MTVQTSIDLTASPTADPMTSTWHSEARSAFWKTVYGHMQRREGARVLEIGAGSWPMFERRWIPETVASYTVNDIDAALLARRPEGYEAACFDMTGDVSAFAGRYDVVFSKFCAEHVSDGVAFHRNILALLAPGGVAVHLIPTLYASPFLVNWLIPERTGWRILNAIHPHRFKNAYPKFPAVYSCCVAGEAAMRRRLAPVGFAKISVRPFWGHHYYDRIPGLRRIENGLCRLAERMGWTGYASYAIVQTEAP